MSLVIPDRQGSRGARMKTRRSFCSVVSMLLPQTTPSRRFEERAARSVGNDVGFE